MSKCFKVQLTDSAKVDFADIVAWTHDNFGPRQARHYAAMLQAALDKLTKSAMPLGAKARYDIGAGVCTLHIAGRGRRGRHLLVYERGDDQEILVIRILHDNMDIARHLPSNDE